MSTGSVHALPYNWCGNLVWFINIFIKNERQSRTESLHVRGLGIRGVGTGEESKEDLDEFGRLFDPLQLPKLEERTIATFFVYHMLANICAFCETILIVALFYLICGRPAGFVQPLFGLIVAAYPLGFLLGSVTFSMVSKHELLMFTRLRGCTVATSLLNLVAWVAILTVFLNVYDDDYFIVLVLVMARFLLGLCSIQQVFPLAFLRHLSARTYPQRDDLSYNFSRAMVGPSLALCLALGLPALSPSDYLETLDPRLLFNVFTLPSWFAIFAVTTTLSYSLLLPSNYAFLSPVPDEAYMARLAEQRDLMYLHRRQEANFYSCGQRVLWADLLLNAVVYSIGWNLPFAVVRSYRYNIFQLYEPVFVGALCALLTHPCLVAFFLKRYRVHKRFSARANVLAVVLGTLSLACCLLSILVDFHSNHSLFPPAFLLGYGIAMALGSIDSLVFDDDDNAQVSVAFSVRRRILAKAAGRFLGTLATGSLLSKTSISSLHPQGQCILQYHEEWSAILLVFCVVTLLCVLTTRQSGCRGVGITPSLTQMDEMLLSQQRTSPDAVSCDPNSVCISLARFGLVVDIDIV